MSLGLITESHHWFLNLLLYIQQHFIKFINFLEKCSEDVNSIMREKRLSVLVLNVLIVVSYESWLSLFVWTSENIMLGLIFLCKNFGKDTVKYIAQAWFVNFYIFLWVFLVLCGCVQGYFMFMVHFLLSLEHVWPLE